VLIPFPFDHVVLGLAEKAVLRPEERANAKQGAVLALEDTGRVLELRRNRSRMKQQANSGAPQFVRPKLMQMIERKEDARRD
jgi:hypothetical protein